MLRFAFLAAATALWVSVFGYVAVLVSLALRRWATRPERPAADGELPDVAVIVPVLNEEGLIAAKLANLRRSDYPADRLVTIVVDGGSTDATTSLVETERERGTAVSLLRVAGSRGRADQLNAALRERSEQIVVVTDADAELDPACIRSLVEVLRADPATDVVGARVRPATRLLEERIHWWILNSLWWLEGEALGNGQVSGVCYALRSSALSALPADCTADDIRFGLLAGSRGRDVRLCRRALATELRVPQTVREFLSFRRRRGAGYLRELRRVRPSGAPLRWQVLQAVRLYHFFVMPILAGAVAVTGAILLATPQWPWPALAGFGFAAPAAAALSASTTVGPGLRWWRVGLAAGRLAGLTWWALLALPRGAAARLDKGE